MGLVIATGTPSYAGGFKNKGAGTLSCGEFVEVTVARNMAMDWAAGFITGINYSEARQSVDEGDIDVFGGIDMNAAEVWLTNYCADNPSDNVAVAVTALVRDVRSRTQ